MPTPWSRAGEPPQVFRASLMISRDKHPDLVQLLWSLPHGKINGYVRDALLARLKDTQAQQRREEDLLRLVERQQVLLEQVAQSLQRMEAALRALQDSASALKAPTPTHSADLSGPSEGAARFAKRF